MAAELGTKGQICWLAGFVMKPVAVIEVAEIFHCANRIRGTTSDSLISRRSGPSPSNSVDTVQRGQAEDRSTSTAVAATSTTRQIPATGASVRRALARDYMTS